MKWAFLAAAIFIILAFQNCGNTNLPVTAAIRNGNLNLGGDISPLPSPSVLAVPVIGNYTVIPLASGMRYEFPITNAADYPAELFAASPDLPPCGLNDQSSRTWVDIFNSDTNVRLNAFCSANLSLSSLTFTAPAGSVTHFKVIFTDRLTGEVAESDIKQIP